jgi:hypothetical protein
MATAPGITKIGGASRWSSARGCPRCASRPCSPRASPRRHARRARASTTIALASPRTRAAGTAPAATAATSVATSRPARPPASSVNAIKRASTTPAAPSPATAAGAPRSARVRGLAPRAVTAAGAPRAAPAPEGAGCTALAATACERMTGAFVAWVRGPRGSIVDPLDLSCAFSTIESQPFHRPMPGRHGRSPSRQNFRGAPESTNAVRRYRQKRSSAFDRLPKQAGRHSRLPRSNRRETVGEPLRIRTCAIRQEPVPAPPPAAKSRSRESVKDDDLRVVPRFSEGRRITRR